MTELYRKAGRVVRYEHGRLLHVDEAGEAIDDGRLFTAAPRDAGLTLPDVDGDAVLQTAWQIERVIAPLGIERLLVSHGIAEHECDGVRWRDEARRVHLSMVAGTLRLLVDLATFDVGHVAALAELFARCGAPRSAPPALRLTPAVAAVLLPSLLDRIEVEQSPSAHDGKGLPVDRCVATPSAVPPNWYRPSYRVRPLRAWLDLRARPFGVVDRALPEAVAILAPPHDGALSVLVVDGHHVHPATMRIGDIAAAGAPAAWYPYGAGVFGGELTVVML